MIEAKPMSEQECLEANLIPKGVYPFTVISAQERSSDKVGAFFSLKLNLVLGGTKLRMCFDALFFREDMMWKTRHFYAATNMLAKYESGKYIAQDLDNAEGYCEVDHRVNKKTGEIEHYVKDYMVPEAKPEAEAKKVEEAPFFDDDIPSLA